VLDAPRGHRLEDTQRPADIVAVVLHRLAHRFADVEKCREVHHGVNLEAANRVCHRCRIVDVAVHQFAPLHGSAMPGDQVVEGDHAVTSLRQGLARVTADVACATRHQNRPRISGQWRNT